MDNSTTDMSQTHYAMYAEMRAERDRLMRDLTDAIQDRSKIACQLIQHKELWAKQEQDYAAHADQLEQDARAARASAVEFYKALTDLRDVCRAVVDRLRAARQCDDPSAVQALIAVGDGALTAILDDIGQRVV